MINISRLKDQYLQLKDLIMKNQYSKDSMLQQLDQIFFHYLEQQFPFVFQKNLLSNQCLRDELQKLYFTQKNEIILQKQYFEILLKIILYVRGHLQYIFIYVFMMVYFKEQKRDSLYSIFYQQLEQSKYINSKWQGGYQILITNLIAQKRFKEIQAIYRQNISFNISFYQFLIYTLILIINKKEIEAIQILKIIIKNAPCQKPFKFGYIQVQYQNNFELTNELQIIFFIISTKTFCRNLLSSQIQQYQKNISNLFQYIKTQTSIQMSKLNLFFFAFFQNLFQNGQKEKLIQILVKNSSEMVLRQIIHYHSTKQLQQARKLYPYSLIFLDQDMKIKFNMKLYKQAIRSNQLIMQQSPNYIYGFYYAGMASLALMDFQKCIFYYQQSLKINKHNPYIYSGLAYLNMLFKNHFKCIQLLKQSQKIKSKNNYSNYLGIDKNENFICYRFNKNQLSQEQKFISSIRDYSFAIIESHDPFLQITKKLIPNYQEKDSHCQSNSETQTFQVIKKETRKTSITELQQYMREKFNNQQFYLFLGKYTFEVGQFQLSFHYFQCYLKLYSYFVEIIPQFLHLAQLSQTFRKRSSIIIEDLKQKGGENILINLFVNCYYKYFGYPQYQTLCLYQLNSLMNECYSNKPLLKYYIIADRFISAFQSLNNHFNDMFLFEYIFVLQLRQQHKKLDKAILALYNRHFSPQFSRPQIFILAYEKQINILKNKQLKELYSQLFPFFMNQEQFNKFQSIYQLKDAQSKIIKRLSNFKNNRIKRNYQKIINVCRRFQNIIDRFQIKEEEQSPFVQEKEFSYINQNLKQYRILSESLMKKKLNTKQRQFKKKLSYFLNNLIHSKTILKNIYSQYFFILAQVRKPQFNVQLFPLLKEYQKVFQLLFKQRDQFQSTIVKYLKQFIEQKKNGTFLAKPNQSTFIITPLNLLLQRISIHLRAFIRQKYFKYLLISYIINKIDYNCSKNQIEELSNFSQYLITFYKDPNLTMFDISYKISQFSKQKTQTYYSNKSLMDIPLLIEYSQIKNNEQTATLKVYLKQLLAQYEQAVSNCTYYCLDLLTNSQYQPVQMIQLKNHYNSNQILNFFISVADILSQLLKQKVFVIDFSILNILHHNNNQYRLKLNNNSVICYKKSNQHCCFELLKQIFHTLKKAKLSNIHLQFDNFNPFFSFFQSFVCDMVKQMNLSQQQNIKAQIDLNTFEERLKKIYIDSYVQIVQEIVKYKQKNVNLQFQKKKFKELLHRNRLLKLGTMSFDKIKNLRESSDQINSTIVKGCADEESSLLVQSLSLAAQNIITIKYKFKDVKFDHKGYDDFKKKLFRNHYQLLQFLTSHRELINVALYNLSKGWSDYFLNKEYFEYQMEKRLLQISKILPIKSRPNFQLFIKQKLKVQSSRNKQDQNFLAYLLTNGRSEILCFMKDIANGIIELQRLGIYHGDLIFRNIIKTNKYKIMDFDRALKLAWESPYKKSIQCFNNTLSLFKNWIQYFFDKNNRIRSNKQGLKSLQILEFIFRDHPQLGEIEQQLFKRNSQQQIVQFFIDKLKQYAQQHHLSQFRILAQCLMCAQLIGQETYFTKEQFDCINGILKKLFENGNYESFCNKLNNFLLSDLKT